MIDIIFRYTCNYNSNQAVYHNSENPMLVFFYLIKWFSKQLNIVIIMKKKHSDNNDIIIIIITIIYIFIFLFIKMITNSNSDLAVPLNSEE